MSLNVNDYRKLGKKGQFTIAAATAGYQDIDSYAPFVGATVPALASATYDIDIITDGATVDKLAVALLVTDDWDGIATKIQAAWRTATGSTETVAITDGSMRFTSATTGLASSISLATGTTGSGGGDLVTAITALSGYTASYGVAVAGTNSDLDTFGYAEISNTGTVGSFPGGTVTGLASATYDLDVTEVGVLRQVATALLNTDTWDGICAKIQTALRAITSGTETVAIVNGKIRVTSDTEGSTSTVVLAAGTAGSGGGDILAAIDAIGATYTTNLDTPVDGTEGDITIDIGTPATGETSKWYLYQVRTSAGIDKSGLKSTYSTTTGLLTISDNLAVTELAAGDVVTWVSGSY